MKASSLIQSSNFIDHPINSTNKSNKLNSNSEGVPSILFNQFSGQLVIHGSSTCKNAEHVYSELQEKINSYIKNRNNHYLNVNFKLKEMNSFSLQPIYKLLQIICNSEEYNIRPRICWHHEKNNDDMLLHGEVFEFILKSEFNFIPY